MILDKKVNMCFECRKKFDNEIFICPYCNGEVVFTLSIGDKKVKGKL